MVRPDYVLWNKVAMFTLREAAFLLCDLEPFDATADRPVPPDVQAMIRQLHQGPEPDGDTGEREFYESFAHRYPAERHNPGEKYYLQETLKRWAARNNIAAPFLFPEQREGGSTGMWPSTYDTKLLRLAREVVWQHWEGKDPKDAPSREWLIERLLERGITRREAEAIDLVTRHDNRSKPGTGRN